MFSILTIFLFSMVKTNIQKNKTVIYNNSLKVKIERNLQIENETDLEAGTDYENIYYINVTNYTFDNQEMNIYIDYSTILFEEITLLITLYIDKYNDSLGYWTHKVVDVRAYYYYDINAYSAYVEDLTLDNLSGDISLTILNIEAESDNISNFYYVNFYEQTFNFQQPSDTDSDNFESTDSTIISVARSTSSGSSTGAIIGIIAGVVGVIGIISGIIIYCFCCKKKDPVGVTDSNSTNTKISISNQTNSTMNTESIKNDIMLSFSTKDQDKKYKKLVPINGNKNLGQMREKYFIEINRTDLINDNNIDFFVGEKRIEIDKKILVKDYLKDYFKTGNEPIIITVVDNKKILKKELNN